MKRDLDRLRDRSDDAYRIAAEDTTRAYAVLQDAVIRYLDKIEEIRRSMEGMLR